MIRHILDLNLRRAIERLQEKWDDEALDAVTAGNPTRAHYIEQFSTKLPELVPQLVTDEGCRGFHSEEWAKTILSPHSLDKERQTR